jgi:hypothetical protein
MFYMILRTVIQKMLNFKHYTTLNTTNILIYMLL